MVSRKLEENIYKKRIDDLFNEWKNKDIHKNQVFISDGVVCPKIWFNSTKRPLFLLKEANNGKDHDWSLINDYLTKNDPIIFKTWKNISLWTKGLLNTTETYIEKYDPDDNVINKFNNKYLNSISVINVKKSHGNKESDMDDILKYAEIDRKYLLEELKICDPNIIICGYTIEALKIILGYDIKKQNNDHLFYYTKFNNHDLMIIDYWHPSNLFPGIMNYYGLMHAYQQAIIKHKEGVGEFL